LPPTATPVPATATPLPATTEPTVTARPPVPLYLPIAHAERCATLPQPLELALVLDTSSSMAAPTAPGGVTKLAAAQAAAEAFMAALRAQDRVAVVVFDGTARLALDLSADQGAARRAIGGLATGLGSRLDLGLAVGRAALAESRPDAAKVLVLLTDGRPSAGAEAVLAAAESARADGVELYTIGLGQDIDAALLAALAGAPGRHYSAPSTADLEAVFDELLGRTHVVCP
jgi:Ca-activated chloride channel family protein